MPCRPLVIAFDQLETMFPLEPMRAKLKELGLPGSALEVWFDRTLRDGMALTLTGTFKTFPEVASAVLDGLAVDHGVNASEKQIEEILGGISALPPHEDVLPALELVRSANVRAVVLSNGPARTTREMLHRSGLDRLIERVISIDEVERWKPAVPVYHHAAQVCGVEIPLMAMVAAHSWDIQGARSAGLTTAWLPRAEKRFSPVMGKPDVKGGTLLETVEQLLSLPLRTSNEGA